jgi:hypothetical protein
LHLDESDLVGAVRTGFVWSILAGIISIVLVVHLQWLTFVPDPWFHPDTTSYLGPALNLLSRHSFSLESYRTPGYPLFLWALIACFHSLPAVAVAQHILLLMTAMLTAILSFRWIKKSFVFSILVFTMIALMPWSLVASHNLLTETVFTFVEVLFVVLFAEAWRTGWRSLWIVTGAATVATISVRPVAVVILAAVPIVLWFYRRRNPRALPSLLYWGLTVLALSGSGCALNFASRGFWGFTTMPRTLYPRVAYLLDVDKIHSVPLANALRPCYTPKDVRLKDPDWVRDGDEGPVSMLRRAGLLYGKEDQVLRQLGWQAIRLHPFIPIADHINRSIRFFWDMYSVPPGYVSPVPASAESIQSYVKFARQYPEVFKMAYFPKLPLQTYLSDMNRIPLFPLQRGNWMATLCWPLRWFELGMPYFLTLALISFGLNHRDPLFDLMALIMVLHILMSTLANDFIPRYAVPLQPIATLLILRAFIFLSFGSTKRSGAETPRIV